MSDEPMLPPRMTLLGEAMRPIWEKVQAEIDRRVPQTEVVVGMGAVVLHHFQSLRDNVPRLTDRINSLMDDVVTNEAAGDAEVYRAAGRFEAFLDDLLADYRSVRALNAYDDDVEVRDLLAGVYGTCMGVPPGLLHRPTLACHLPELSWLHIALSDMLHR
jgi:hypothetical protein